jgi:hypothetical protein
MATVIAFISAEEHEIAIAELRAEFRDMLGAYVTDHEQWLTTEQALKVANISRATLALRRASAPEREEPGHITYKKEGTKSWYSRSSCVNYRRNKKGLPALAA